MIHCDNNSGDSDDFGKSVNYIKDNNTTGDGYD